MEKEKKKKRKKEKSVVALKAVRGCGLTWLNVAALFRRGLCVFRGRRGRAFACRSEHPYSTVRAFAVLFCGTVLNSASGLSKRGASGQAGKPRRRGKRQRGNRLLISLYKRERSRAFRARPEVLQTGREVASHEFVSPVSSRCIFSLRVETLQRNY